MRVVWTSEGAVTGAATLLKPKRGQIPEAGWKWERMADGCCVMTNGGAAASLILDFGRELHGGMSFGAETKGPIIMARTRRIKRDRDAHNHLMFRTGGLVHSEHPENPSP